MGQVSSGWYPLYKPNAVGITINWSESISGNKNTVTFSMIVRSKYRISGTWKCGFIADGTDFGSPRVRIEHGTKNTAGQTTVRTGMTKTFTYSGSKSISITASLPDMSYYDVDEGWSSNAIYQPKFTTTINLKTNNSPPPKPSITCTNGKVGGNHLVENSMDIELSAVTDPDGNVVTYAAYGQCKRPGNDWERIGDANSCILWSSSSRKVSYPVSGYPRGTQFRVWGKAVDSNGASSSTTGYYSNIYRNHLPNTVSEILPKEGYFNGSSFNISWKNPGDPNGNTPTFNLYLSKNNGDYSRVLNNSSATSYTQNISSDPEGTKYRFKIAAYDGLVEGNYTYSNTYVKNTKPTKPTQIFPSSGFYLGNVAISWNRSTDPENRGISYYDVYINDTRIGSSTTNSINWYIPDSDPAEKTYTISVIAVDVDGKASDKGYATGAFKKAKPPVAPSWIRPDETYFESEIGLTWENVSSNGASVSYELAYRINGGGWNVISSTLKNTKYTHNITGINRGSKIEYRIKCTNSFGQTSPYAYSKAYYRNQIPVTPTISYPIANSTVHDSTPRIAFSISKELDGQNQTIFVECGGKTYNSVSNKDMFSKKSGTYSTAEKIIFTCSELSEGSNTISIYVNDGMINSSKATRTFNVSSSNLSAKKGNVVTAELYNNIRSQINSVRKAYGLSDYNFTGNIIKNGIIKFSYITEMRQAIIEARNAINNYDSSNPDKITTSWIDSAKNDVIYATVVQQIIDIIKNT